jgi:DNA-binding MarR family transcriptional regulator
MSDIDDDVAAFLTGMDALVERLEPPRRPQDAGVAECTVREISALRALGRHRHGRLSMSELATLINVPLSTATRIVEGLVSKGLVERKSSARDGRIVEIVFARRGNEINRYIEESRDAEAKALLSALSERQRAVFLSQLARLLEDEPPVE